MLQQYSNVRSVYNDTEAIMQGAAPFDKTKIPWDTYLRIFELDPLVSGASIKELSDIYLSEGGSPRVWGNPSFQRAYLLYFLPLNLNRALSVFAWGEQVGFFGHVSQVNEFGGGPGTLAWAAKLYGFDWSWFNDEASLEARKAEAVLTQQFQIRKTSRKHPADTSLFLSSYTLTETPLPKEAFDHQAVMLIEASTQQNFQRLAKVRSQLITNGFFVWAPCPHQMSCPMAGQIKDWCHLRVPFLHRPSWFDQLETQIPMRNDTLTLSYLLARRDPPPYTSERKIRIIGQTLKEKGKHRQTVCRGPNREFLSWLIREGAPPRLESGALIDEPKDLIIKGNEIRFPRK